jgi:GntR family transcriptional regulator, vanillate catabolism transcriptional regulator
MNRRSGADGERSQTLKALLTVREMILDGALAPGERISELSIVDRTGVSRTPVRSALARRAEEGLLEPIPSGGFSVRSFGEGDIHDAIEIRGVLEGLAARFAAERGVAPSRLLPIKDCLAELDELVMESPLDQEDFARYIVLNATFHRLLHALADSPVLEREIERAAAKPFASPSGFVMAQSALPEARTVLTVAQDQHRAVIEAIENREGARAEAMMREHARLASRNLRAALRSKQAMALVPGAALISGRRT